MTIHYRRANLEDASALACIEQACFSRPWSQASLEEYLADRDKKIFYVAYTHTDDIVGYMGSSFVLDEGDVTNVATLPAYRKQGIAKHLVGHVMKALGTLGVKTLFLEVRQSNAPAIHMYTEMGFQTIAQRKHYYSHPTEDAFIMSVHLGEDA